MSETVAIRAVVITLSDSGHAGLRDDESGAVLEGLLKELGAEYVERVLLPDEELLLSEKLIHYADRTPANLILTTGGTGFTSRDVTPEATRAAFDREAPGFAEAMRAASLAKTPHAMLSRAVSGLRGTTLIINFPGSPRACREQFAVIRDALPHALEKLADLGGDCARLDV
ncbi:MAG: MogA/MoaB family molybdenum cofactor biosynthesis protein [Thermoleophilia bacterium]